MQMNYLAFSSAGSITSISILQTGPNNERPHPPIAPLPFRQLKKDYVAGLRDSVDVVPIGAWYGQGRKVGSGVWGEGQGKIWAGTGCVSV